MSKVLEEARKRFEGRFVKVEVVPPLTHFIGYSSSPPEEPQQGNHYEALEKGNSEEEAVRKWEDKMNSLPVEGDHLLWRVEPEMDVHKNYDAQKDVWVVYGRFTCLTAD